MAFVLPVSKDQSLGHEKNSDKAGFRMFNSHIEHARESLKPDLNTI